MAIEKLDGDDYRRVRGTDFIRKGLKRIWELLLALSSLGSTSQGEGAALVGISNGGGGMAAPFTGTTVQAALTEAMARANDAHSDAADAHGDAAGAAQVAAAAVPAATLASGAHGSGASLVGIEDSGRIIDASTVEGALAEVAAKAIKGIKSGALSLSDATPSTDISAAGLNAGFKINNAAVTIADPAGLDTAQKIVDAFNLALAGGGAAAYVMSVQGGRYLLTSVARGTGTACAVTAGVNDVAASLKLGVANGGTELAGTDDATTALGIEVAARKALEARVLALENA